MTKEQAENIINTMWTFGDMSNYQEPIYLFTEGEYIVNPTFVDYCKDIGYYND